RQGRPRGRPGHHHRHRVRMKPGHKTTEFWLTVCVVVGSIAASIAAAPVAAPVAIAAGAVSSGLAAGAYALSRGRVKVAAMERETALEARLPIRPGKTP